MSVSGLLSEFRQLDIQLRMEGDRLLCNARAGVLTPELRERLRRQKNDIVKFLRSTQALAAQQGAIVPLQQKGNKIPVFAVPGHNGDVFCYRALAQALGEEQPFFALQPPGLDGRSAPLTRVADLAGYFANQVRAFRPRGPYIVAGFCAGGTVAFELAQLLLAGGEAGGFLALFGAPYPSFFRLLGQLRYRMAHKVARLRELAAALHGKPWRQRFRRPNAGTSLELETAPRDAALEAVLALRASVEQSTLAAVRGYEPSYFPGRVHLFMPCRIWAQSSFGAERWQSVARHAESHFGPEGCTGDNMLLAPHTAIFAEFFRRSCEQFRESSDSPIAIGERLPGDAVRRLSALRGRSDDRDGSGLTAA